MKTTIELAKECGAVFQNVYANCPSDIDETIFTRITLEAFHNACIANNSREVFNATIELCLSKFNYAMTKSAIEESIRILTLPNDGE